MRLKLRIEPIPNFTWGISLANKLPKEEWDELRQKAYKDSNWTCEICGASGVTLHCHERWEFDDKRKIQRLVRLECCCELCHDVHHYGRSKQIKSVSYLIKLVEHWCKVNKKTKKDFMLYESEVRAINYKRADIDYIVKIGRRTLY
jgi:hypothetical protein